MKVTSVNETIRSTDDPTSIRVEGSYIVLTYGLVEVYYNDQGREVFRVTPDPPTPKPPSRPSLFSRLWCVIVNRLKYEWALLPDHPESL